MRTYLKPQREKRKRNCPVEEETNNGKRKEENEQETPGSEH